MPPPPARDSERASRHRQRQLDPRLRDRGPGRRRGARPQHPSDSRCRGHGLLPGHRGAGARRRGGRRPSPEPSRTAGRLVTAADPTPPGDAGRPGAGVTRGPATLAEHLLDAGVTPALRAVLETLAAAGAQLGHEIARAPLAGWLGETGAVNVHGDRVRRLDARANEVLLAALQSSGVVSVVASEELATPAVWPRADAPENFSVCLDPLDGSLNTDVAGVLGTIFAIRPGSGAREPDPA